ncbi:MAG: zinc-binding dehydrogenase [Theionarchaea archaeon]|nr:zinc-binding dehydrogenase [Theionarchaea archaeon]
MKYKCVIVTERGGPEVLHVIENDLHAPSAGKVRVRILAAPVCGPDVSARYGHTPFAPKTPFVPGYAVVGIVDAVGERVTRTAVGDRVAALTVSGGYAEYILLDEDHLIPVPSTLDPADVATIILNYLVAYQILHRKAQVRAGDKVLVIGASGGVGTAFLQLARLANLTVYGLASKSKHGVLTDLDAIPIDYYTQDFVKVIKEAEPDGLDAVFDGMGGTYLARGFSLLKHGGTWVAYGNPLSFSRLMRLLGQVFLLNVLPNGKSVKLYGTGAFRFRKRPFLEDWATLFELLEEGKISPIILRRFPILEAAKANELLESGTVVGNIVLLAPELLKNHG